MKTIGQLLTKLASFERQLHWGDVIAVFALILGALSYFESRAAREESRRALFEAAAEDLSMQTARVNDEYPTTFSRGFCFRCPVPSAGIVEALWDVTIINSGQRDVALIEYEVASTQGVFEQYDRGLFDAVGSEPVRLPLAVAAGHAVRFRVRSLLILPPEVAVALERLQPFPRQLPSVANLFEHLYAMGIDCFGNKVTGGPGGYNFVESDSLNDQRLRVTFRTGRGGIVVDTLTWYGPPYGYLPWPRRPVARALEVPKSRERSNTGLEPTAR